MPRKTTILIVILALVTGILIFLAIRSDQTFNLTNSSDQQNPTPVIQVPFASLYFLQPEINGADNAQKSIDIILDTGGSAVAGAQVELSYDPAVVANVSLESPQNPIFGTNANVLISSVDPAQGRISYAVGIGSDDAEVTGVGSIVTLKFSVNNVQEGVSQITFLPKSAVTTFSSQESVLKETTPLRITFTTPAQTSGN